MRSEKTRDPVDGGGRGGFSLSSLVHRTDLGLALVILAVCAALYYATTTFEKVSPLFAQNLPPEFFPRMLIWTMVVLTLLLPFEHLVLKKGKQDIDQDRSDRVQPKAFMTAILLFAVIVSTYGLGTMLTMVVVCVLLPLLWGERRPTVLIAFAVLFPGAVTLLFTQVLKVPFEPGALGIVLY